MGQAAVYIVDYDLPADHRRKRFYRAVSRYLREHGTEDTGWSTQSVLITRDEGFAEYVYQEACRVGGKTRMWRATPVKGQVGQGGR